MTAVPIIDVHGHVPPDRSTIPRMIESMEVNHISLLFLSSLGRDDWPEFPTADQVAEANDDTFELCARFPDRFRGYVYLNPTLAWEDELARRQSSPHFVGVKL